MGEAADWTHFGWQSIWSLWLSSRDGVWRRTTITGRSSPLLISGLYECPDDVCSQLVFTKRQQREISFFALMKTRLNSLINKPIHNSE